MPLTILTHLTVGAVAAALVAVCMLRLMYLRERALLGQLTAKDEQIAQEQRDLDEANFTLLALSRSVIAAAQRVSHQQEVVPTDPMAGLQRIHAVVEAQTLSLVELQRQISLVREEGETAKARAKELRKELARQTSPSFGAVSQAHQLTRERAKRVAASAQLKAARAELDDLRTKLRFANRAIITLEERLGETTAPILRKSLRERSERARSDQAPMMTPGNDRVQ